MQNLNNEESQLNDENSGCRQNGRWCAEEHSKFL